MSPLRDQSPIRAGPRSGHYREVDHVDALAALSFAAAPAQARDYYRHDRGGDDAAIAIGAGVVGLALGAAIASSSRDRDYYYYDDGYYYPRGYYRDYPRYYDRRVYVYPRHYYRRDRWRGWRGDGWRRGHGWGHRGRWGY
jgi:hypothetical protein